MRFVPGVIGHELAAAEDSFEQGMLDCPHYTRPEVFEGKSGAGSTAKRRSQENSRVAAQTGLRKDPKGAARFDEKMIKILRRRINMSKTCSHSKAGTEAA